MLGKLHILFICALLLFAVTGCYNIQNQNNDPHHIHASKSGYITVEDGKLFYQRFGMGDPIIIVHGGPGLDQSYLLPQMLELAKDYEVIFYNQRGSGRSLDSNIDPKYVSAEQFVQDLEMLRSQLNLKKVVLMGHSWGGFLSMNYAIKYPKNITSLILLNSAPADYKGQKSFADEFTLRTQSIKQKISSLFSYEDFSALDKAQVNQLYRDLFAVYFTNPAEVEKLTLNITKESAVSGFRVMELMSKASLFRLQINLFPELRKLNIPTLIIHGNQDIVPVYTAKEIKDAIPNSKIVYLNNCGHFPYIEKPNEFFSSIRSFVSKTEGK